MRCGDMRSASAACRLAEMLAAGPVSVEQGHTVYIDEAITSLRGELSRWVKHSEEKRMPDLQASADRQAM
jgi:hypothetical protein